VLIGGTKPANTPLGKGGAACVELPVLRAGAGQLRWLMRNKQLRMIANS
jgi:hypothetical protein